MRVWLWVGYKFTKNYCHLRLFSEFIQTQKKYPTFLDKTRILTWKLLSYEANIFLVRETPREHTPCKISYLSLRLQPTVLLRISSWFFNVYLLLGEGASIKYLTLLLPSMYPAISLIIRYKGFTQSVLS